jgi:hypothetical protein
MVNGMDRLNSSKIFFVQSLIQAKPKDGVAPRNEMKMNNLNINPRLKALLIKRYRLFKNQRWNQESRNDVFPER